MPTVTRTSVYLPLTTVYDSGTRFVTTWVYTTGPVTPGANGLYTTTATVTHTERDPDWYSEDEFVWASLITGWVCLLVSGLFFIACAVMWWCRWREQRRAKAVVSDHVAKQASGI